MHASYNYDEYKLTWQDRINDENQEATQEYHPSHSLLFLFYLFYLICRKTGWHVTYVCVPLNGIVVSLCCPLIIFKGNSLTIKIW